MIIPCDQQSKSWICSRNSCNVSWDTCTEMIFAAMWLLALTSEGNLDVYLWETRSKMWRKPAVQYYGTFQESNIYSHTTDIVKKAILPQKARHLDVSGILEVLLSCVLQHMTLRACVELWAGDPSFRIHSWLKNSLPLSGKIVFYWACSFDRDTHGVVNEKGVPS